MQSLATFLESVSDKDIYKAMSALAKKHGVKIDISVYHKPGVSAFNLDELEVPKDKRNSGIGKKAMQDIVDFARKNNVMILLTPDSSYGTPLNVLEKFYTSFGFRKITDDDPNWMGQDMVFVP